MTSRKVIQAISIFLLIVGFLVPSASLAQNNCFQKNGWGVVCTTDTGTNPQNIRVLVNGKKAGNFSELQIYHDVAGLGAPQIFSVKGNGALRPVLPPPGEFGGTFYGTQFYDCNDILSQELYITALDVRLSGKNLVLKGTASSLALKSTNFTILIYPPKKNLVRAKVSYTLFASQAICVSPTRQINHEGFRIAHIASHFISSADLDSDMAHYSGPKKVIQCAALQNVDGFIFTNPLSMSKPPLFLDHTSQLPRNTPTLSITFGVPPFKEIIPQGFVTSTIDPKADNVDLWGNWTNMKHTVTKGKKVGTFSFILDATPPAPITCP